MLSRSAFEASRYNSCSCLHDAYRDCFCGRGLSMRTVVFEWDEHVRLRVVRRRNAGWRRVGDEAKTHRSSLRPRKHTNDVDDVAVAAARSSRFTITM